MFGTQHWALVGSRAAVGGECTEREWVVGVRLVTMGIGEVEYLSSIYARSVVVETPWSPFSTPLACALLVERHLIS